MANDELGALRKALNKNDVEPLLQTVFEQAPQQTFALPAQPIVEYREGATVFMDPIYTVDPGIDWYSIGERAFKLGGDLFGKTLDYLIDSKANSLADLSDMYRSKLDDAYTNLSRTAQKSNSFNDDTKLAKMGGISWKDAKARSSESNDVVTDGILSEIEGIKIEWRKKANEVLENGTGNWFAPAIDYWDENLPSMMDQLGTKYQQLAVAARKADRSIMDQAEKLLFESQFAKPSGKNGTSESVNTKFLAGLLPVIAAGDKGLRSDGTKRFHTIDPTTGNETPITVNGRPLIVMDSEGNTRFNPSLYSVSPQLVFNAIDNEDDFKYYLNLEQNTTDMSAYASFDGTLTPEYTKIVQDVLSRPRSTRNPMDMWKIAAVFASLPPESIANYSQNNKMSQTESDELLITVDAARMGYGPDELTKFRTMSIEDLTESRKIWGVMTDMQLATGSGTMAAGDTALQAQNYINNIATPIIGALLGLSEEQQTQYFVGLTGDKRIYDPQPGENLATLLSRNQILQVPVIKALSYFKANPLLLVDENGKARSPEKIKEAVTQYIQTETTRAGIVTVIDPDTKQPVSFYNRDMVWANSILQEPEKTLPAFMATPASNLYRGSTRETPAEIDFGIARNVFGKSIDREIFAAIYGNISTVVTEKGTETSYTGLPLAETLRLGAACNPDVWRKYGWKGTEDTKLEAAMAALADIKPASEWGIKVDLTGRYDAFASTQRGGLALGFNSIPTQQGSDLFDSVINRQRMSLTGPSFTPEKGNTGTPALYIPATAPEGNLTKTFTQQLFTAKRERESNNPMYTIVTGDSIPASTPQELDVIIEQVDGFASIPELAQSFAYVKNEVIQDTETAYRFLNLNQRAILSVVKNNPEYKKGVQLMLSDFDSAPNDRVLFTPDNVSKLVKAANEKGINNAFDFTSYVLAVAQAKATNKKTVFAKNPEKIKAIQTGFENLNIPINFDETSFFIPNTGVDTDYNGRVLYEQGTPEFFAGIKKYANEGYNVYSSDINTYYLKKIDEPIDEGLTLVLPGRTPAESEADYNTKYSQVFGQREGDLQRSNKIKEQVQKIFAPVSSPSFIQTKVEKPMVLPSQMIEGFKKAIQTFEYRNNIGFSNNANRMNQLYDTMLFYDLPKLYYETGTLDYSLDKLPEKYRLPGHSKHPATKPYFKPGTGTGMNTFREIGKGLLDAGSAVLNLEGTLQQQANIPRFNERSFKIGKALEQGNLTYVFSEMFEEPVSILRMQDSELTERINQNSANFLLLAFDKEFIPFPEGKTKEYGISKQAYDKAQRFKIMEWTPEQFEYQIRAVTTNTPKQTGAVDVDGIVLQLDPSEFILDSKLKEKLKRDLILGMPKEPFPNRTKAESDRQRISDLNAVLDDPKQFVELKKQYLSYSLTPGMRGNLKSKDKAKIDYLAQVFWTTYNK